MSAAGVNLLLPELWTGGRCIEWGSRSSPPFPGVALRAGHDGGICLLRFREPITMASALDLRLKLNKGTACSNHVVLLTTAEGVTSLQQPFGPEDSGALYRWDCEKKMLVVPDGAASSAVCSRLREYDLHLSLGRSQAGFEDDACDQLQAPLALDRRPLHFFIGVDCAKAAERGVAKEACGGATLFSFAEIREPCDASMCGGAARGTPRGSRLYGSPSSRGCTCECAPGFGGQLCELNTTHPSPTTPRRPALGSSPPPPVAPHAAPHAAPAARPPNGASGRLAGLPLPQWLKGSSSWWRLAALVAAGAASIPLLVLAVCALSLRLRGGSAWQAVSAEDEEESSSWLRRMEPSERKAAAGWGDDDIDSVASDHGRSSPAPSTPLMSNGGGDGGSGGGADKADDGGSGRGATPASAAAHAARLAAVAVATHHEANAIASPGLDSSADAEGAEALVSFELERGGAQARALLSLRGAARDAESLLALLARAGGEALGRPLRPQQLHVRYELAGSGADGAAPLLLVLTSATPIAHALRSSSLHVRVADATDEPPPLPTDAAMQPDAFRHAIEMERIAIAAAARSSAAASGAGVDAASASKGEPEPPPPRRKTSWTPPLGSIAESPQPPSKGRPAASGARPVC